MAKKAKKAKAKKAKAKKRLPVRWAAAPRSKAKNAYDLLDDVCKVILEEPKRYDQGDWIVSIASDYSTPAAAVKCQTPYPIPACGTIGCVAGWTALLARPTIAVHVDRLDAQVMGDAVRILGINRGQATRLFDGGAVRNQWRQDFGNNKKFPMTGTMGYAKLGVAHIREFMKDYADQLRAHKVTR